MTKDEGEIQKSLGLAKTYKVRVFLQRKDVYVVCIGEHVVDAQSEDDAVASVHTTWYPGRDVMFEVTLK